MTDAPVALVTGAARGIGAAIVHRLAGAGWCVVAVDACVRDPRMSYAPATRQQLTSVAESHPGTVLDVVADARDLSALVDAVHAAESEFGRLDAAVAAAAVLTGEGVVWETDPVGWEPMFDVGVHGVANLARAAVPALLRNTDPRSGRFVAVASSAAHHGMWQLAGYNAANHAIVGLVKGLARDLRGTGITAAAVSTGSTRTDLLTEQARIYGLDNVDAFAGHQLLDRILDPDEIAAVVAWLCSKDGGVINGSVVHADGGFLP
ncbi:mycofactocin-coupled SDR family oxidoreductase [Nocardia sp. NPDC055029]